MNTTQPPKLKWVPLEEEEEELGQSVAAPAQAARCHRLQNPLLSTSLCAITAGYGLGGDQGVRRCALDFTADVGKQ